MQYQIKWTSRFNNVSGKGTGKFSKEQAKFIVEELNIELDANCVYTVILANDDDLRNTRSNRRQ